MSKYEDLVLLDPAEIYKLHTGRITFEENYDDELPDDASEEVLAKYRPPLYTYEELEKNLIVIKNQSDMENEDDATKSTHDLTDLNLSLIEKEVFKLVVPNYCLLCKKEFPSNPHNFLLHINGKKHNGVLKQYMLTRHCQLKNSANTHLITQAEAALLYRSHERVQKLMLTDFCSVCYLSLIGVKDRKNHFKSAKHKAKERISRKNLAKSLNDSKGDYQYLCYVCDVSITSRADALTHTLQGSHIKARENCAKPEKLNRKKTKKSEPASPNSPHELSDPPSEPSTAQLTPECSTKKCSSPTERNFDAQQCGETINDIATQSLLSRTPEPDSLRAELNAEVDKLISNINSEKCVISEHVLLALRTLNENIKSIADGNVVHSNDAQPKTSPEGSVLQPYDILISITGCASLILITGCTLLLFRALRH